MTYQTIADALGCSRRSLWLYRQDPTFPGRGATITEMGNWLSTHRGHAAGKSTPAEPLDDNENWTLRLKRAQALKTELQTAQGKAKLLLHFREQLQAEMHEFLGRFRNTVHSLGLTPKQAAAVNRAIAACLSSPD